MQRRYRKNRKQGNHTLPAVAIGITVAALAIGGLFYKGEDILRYFKGQTITVHSNKEANDNLNRLLGDLSGDKARLLELAENSTTRLGWIENVDTRRQFRWFLMSRLVDKGLWEEAVRILPEVESLAPVEGLDRLAQAALEHEDYELQLRLDSQLQNKLMNAPEQTVLLLRSIRRYAETCIRMKRNDDAVHAITRLDAPAIMVRLSDPTLATDAADLQMKRANICGVPEPVLQNVRNILEQAKWPLCPATSQLMLKEVHNVLRDNPNIPGNALKEIEEKLLHCRDAMLEYPDKEHRLPTCYTLLGEIRYRLQNYAGCAQALSLAAAFAEGYGEMTPELQVKLRRLSSRANEARGAVTEAMQDCRYLLEHEKDNTEILRCITFMAKHAEGEEKMELLMRCWNMMQENASLSDNARKTEIINELSAWYLQKEDYSNAAKWIEQSTRMIEAAHPVLSDGKALQARLELALVQRKAMLDTTAIRKLRDLKREVDQMTEEDRARLDAAAPQLYKSIVREFARSCLLVGDKTTAKALARSIKESIPEKKR